MFADVVQTAERPPLKKELPVFVIDMIKKITLDTPQMTFDGINMALSLKMSGSGGVVDILLETMEKYTRQLEERVKLHLLH